MSFINCFFLFVGSIAGTGGLDLNAEISTRYEILHSSLNANQRAEEMRALVAALTSADRDDVAGISDASVDQVASLLKVDGVNGWLFGSEALQILGCRAKRALPQLKQALEAAQPVASESLGGLILSPPVDARPNIEAAIHRIEEAPPCR
jgi:hypothetical protein